MSKSNKKATRHHTDRLYEETIEKITEIAEQFGNKADAYAAMIDAYNLLNVSEHPHFGEQIKKISASFQDIVGAFNIVITESDAIEDAAKKDADHWNQLYNEYVAKAQEINRQRNETILEQTETIAKLEKDIENLKATMITNEEIKNIKIELEKFRSSSDEINRLREENETQRKTVFNLEEELRKLRITSVINNNEEKEAI